MASRTISDFTTLASLQDTDLLLVSSSGGTYTVPVSLFKDAAKSALSDEIIGVLEQLEQSGAQIEVVTSSQWGTITGNITTQADLQQLIQSINSSINLKIDRSEATALLNTKANSSNVYTKQETSDLIAAGNFISNGTTDDISLGGDIAVKSNGLLKVVSAQQTYSCSGNTSTALTSFNVDPGDGWTMLCVAGFALGSNSMVCRAMNISSGTPGIGVRNVTSSAVNDATATIWVLCIRTSL